MTPSTTESEIPSDENQWIKRPPLLFLYDPTQASDPDGISEGLSTKDKGVLQDYLGLWTRNIQ